jgi:GST-like protein
VQLDLYGTPGWGSAIVEAQLTWYGLPFAFHDTGDVLKDHAARERLAKLNPLGQMPTLLIDGKVMTESAAITLWLADVTGRDDLVPGPAAPERAEFLRWLIFIVANIYPTYTYADLPGRFVPVEAAQKPFADAVNGYAKRLYLQLESQAGAPWFLGARMSALDIYLAVLTRWRPGKSWFEAETPKLFARAAAVHAQLQLKPVWTHNFPTDAS